MNNADIDRHMDRLFAAARAKPLIEEVLEERHSTHGDFHQDARIAQALKHVIREGVNWGELTPEMREALDNMMTKVARILAGDPNYSEHWADMIGYATLVLRSLGAWAGG